jgi:predicted peptidase
VQPSLPAGLEKRSYRFEPTGEQLEYVVFVPGRAGKTKPAPLVIALHGATVPAATIMIDLVDPARKHGYIIAAPTGYTLTGWYGARRLGASPEFLRITEFSEQDVMNVLEIVRRKYKIDEKRIYLVGHSMGGAGVIHLGSKYPQIWAAAAALAPAVLEDPTDTFGNMQQMPLLIIQGDTDTLLPIDGTRRMVARLREAGVSTDYLEIKGGGHGAPAQQGAAVFQFFEKHKPDGKLP